MSLRISLRGGEKVIVNGAVLTSVGRTDLLVENRAAIMRGREVMAPEEATTPARRLYFTCMLAYIDPDNLGTHLDEIVVLLHDLMSALEGVEGKAACVSFARKIALGEYYKALADCRTLIDYETTALARLDVRAA